MCIHHVYFIRLYCEYTWLWIHLMIVDIHESFSCYIYMYYIYIYIYMYIIAYIYIYIYYIYYIYWDSVVVVWNREDFLKEAYKQLDDREVYEEVPNDPNILVNTIMKALEKIRVRGDLSSDTLNSQFLLNSYFLDSIFYQKFINACMTYRVDQLFQTTVFALRIYLHFWLPFATTCSES